MAKNLKVQQENDLLAELLDLESELAEIKILEAHTKARYENARERIFRIFDTLFGKDAPASYQSPISGKYLARELRPLNPEEYPIINQETLKAQLSDDQWSMITDHVLVLNEEKLIKAIEEEKLASSVLDLAVSYPKQREYLTYREPTKAEQQAQSTEPANIARKRSRQ